MAKSGYLFFFTRGLELYGIFYAIYYIISIREEKMSDRGKKKRDRREAESERGQEMSGVSKDCVCFSV